MAGVRFTSHGPDERMQMAVVLSPWCLVIRQRASMERTGSRTDPELLVISYAESSNGSYHGLHRQGGGVVGWQADSPGLRGLWVGSGQHVEVGGGALRDEPWARPPRRRGLSPNETKARHRQRARARK